MKSTLISPSSKSRCSAGFTLVEVLVAIAVLGILMLVLADIFNVMNKTWVYGQGKVNNFTKARAMLNVLENDFRNAILRPDLAGFTFPNNTTSRIEFYTQRPGVPAGGTDPTMVRNISIVEYGLNNASPGDIGYEDSPATSTLVRYDAPILWSDTAAAWTFGTNPLTFPTSPAVTLTARDTAPGVIAFQVVFVQSDASYSTTTFTPAVTSAGVANLTPTRGIGITLVVLDDQVMRALSTNGAQIKKLQEDFANAVSGTKDVKSDWDAYINNWSNTLGKDVPVYPKSLGTGIGVYECYVSIP